MFSLEGRTALVTGASRGIGEACARALDRAGARVALAARSESDLEKVAGDLTNDPVVVVSDLGQPGAAAALMSDVVERFGGLDVLVNNAGIAPAGSTAELSEDDLDPVIGLNQRAALILAGRAAGHMAGRGGGSIVNMSSAAGMAGVRWQAAYAATKGAMDAMTRALAAEWGPKGVRVNAVNPGVIRTDMWEPYLGMPGLEDHLVGLIPLRRLGTAEDIADVVLFLASDAARYITAQTLVIDGGALHTVPLMPRSVTGD
jgi:NAD(P)-dependent dehydrogenase (short-subunit alcohol dehydrogenase family)